MRKKGTKIGVQPPFSFWFTDLSMLERSPEYKIFLALSRERTGVQRPTFQHRELHSSVAPSFPNSSFVFLLSLLIFKAPQLRFIHLFTFLNFNLISPFTLNKGNAPI